MAPAEAQYPVAASDRAEFGSDLSDETLLTRSADGDELAWEQLVDRYLASMWAAVSVSGVSTPVAHSIIELVWLRLSQRLDAPPTLLRPWLLEAIEDAARHVCGRRNGVDTVSINAAGLLPSVPYPR